MKLLTEFQELINNDHMTERKYWSFKPFDSKLNKNWEVLYIFNDSCIRYPTLKLLFDIFLGSAAT